MANKINYAVVFALFDVTNYAIINANDYHIFQNDIDFTKTRKALTFSVSSTTFSIFSVVLSLDSIPRRNSQTYNHYFNVYLSSFITEEILSH